MAISFVVLGEIRIVPSNSVQTGNSVFVMFGQFLSIGGRKRNDDLGKGRNDVKG